MALDSVTQGAEPANQQSRRVALLQHSWSNPNLGVVALSECNLELIRLAAEVAGVTIEVDVVASAQPECLPNGVGSCVVPVSLRPWAIWRTWPRAVLALRQYDLAIDIGEGDGFASIYGRKRLLWQWYLKAAAVAAKVPLVLAPQTYGPFNGRIDRFLFKRIARASVLCTARDEESAKLAESVRRGAETLRVADVAFRLTPDTSFALSKSPARRVGLNVSGLLWAARPGDDFLVDGYQNLIRRLLEGLLGAGFEVHLIEHVRGGAAEHEERSDRWAAEQLAVEFPAARVAPRFPTPAAAKGYLASMDFFVGSRMHACIGAASAGVDVRAISYSRKFAGTFHLVGFDCALDPQIPAERVVHQLLDELSENHDDHKRLNTAFITDSHEQYVRAVATQLRRSDR